MTSSARTGSRRWPALGATLVLASCAAAPEAPPEQAAPPATAPSAPIPRVLSFAFAGDGSSPATWEPLSQELETAFATMDGVAMVASETRADGFSVQATLSPESPPVTAFDRTASAFDERHPELHRVR